MFGGILKIAGPRNSTEGAEAQMTPSSLETKDFLKRRIEEASQVRRRRPALPLARSAASPRPSRATRSRVEQQAAKLRLIVEVAQEVWG